MQRLDRQTGTLHGYKNNYYLEVEGLKYRIFEFDYHKVKESDKRGSAQLFQYQNSVDGFDGYVHMGSLRIETEALNISD
ncbi:MAG TPA: hypothetical protein IGS53_26235 [Leptolyngbyaceae cyanobacterium M33_DOE_097]|nr:hypothetical protein [Leptolyngbyaceae cyanobacterium M33_DOE_097]